MSPTQLHHLLKDVPHGIQLIDVREPYEHEICNIGGELIPMAKLIESLDRFDRQTMTVIYCKSGGRSAQALMLFLQAGFTNVHHLEGGILQWQATIDPQLVRY